MKLSYDDKLKIYELKKKGLSWSQISQHYKINPSNLQYMIRLMDRYGIEIAKKGKSPYLFSLNIFNCHVI